MEGGRLPQQTAKSSFAADAWQPDNSEERLLAFLEALILDIARTHPRVTEVQIALWLARVVVGGSHGRR